MCIFFFISTLQSPVAQIIAAVIGHISCTYNNRMSIVCAFVIRSSTFASVSVYTRVSCISSRISRRPTPRACLSFVFYVVACRAVVVVVVVVVAATTAVARWRKTNNAPGRIIEKASLLDFTRFGELKI